MRATFEAQNPESINFTIQITMSLKDWNELDELLENAWPATELKSLIRSACDQANKTYYPQIREDE